MQVILDSSFASQGLAPIRGGKKRQFRDWTTFPVVTVTGVRDRKIRTALRTNRALLEKNERIYLSFPTATPLCSRAFKSPTFFILFVCDVDEL